MSAPPCGQCDNGWVTIREESVGEDGRTIYLASIKRCEDCLGTGKQGGGW